MQNQIPKNWQKVKLGEVVDITSSKRIFAHEYLKEGIPFYRGKEIIEKFNGNNVSTDLFISPGKFEEIKARFGAPQQGDMLLTSVGTLGIPYLVKENERFYFKDGNLTWFRKFNGINNEFLYYWIQSPSGKGQITKHIIGSSQQALTIDGLKKIETSLPSLKEQEQIVSVLSAVDDKIEVNNKIAKALEEMAQAIFKEWFSKRNGKEYSLLDVADYINGGAFGKIVNKNKKGLPLIKIADLNRGLTDNTEWIDKEVDDRYYIKDGNLLFSWSGSVGVYIWDNGPAILNQHIFNVLPKNVFTLGFLYFLLKNKVRIFQHTAGAKATTMGHIKKEHLRDESVFISENRDLKTFDTFYAQIVNLRLENQKLTALRDLLLPKLMSGEIKI